MRARRSPPPRLSLALAGCGAPSVAAAKPDVDGCAGSWLRPTAGNEAGARGDAVPHQRAARATAGAADREPAARAGRRAALARHGRAQVLRAQNPDGVQPDAGIVRQAPPPILVGENLAWGETDQSPPAVIVALWMDEPGPPGQHPPARLPRDRHRHGLRRARARSGAEAGRDLHDDVRGRRALSSGWPYCPAGATARGRWRIWRVAGTGRRLSFRSGLFGFVGPNGAKRASDRLARPTGEVVAGGRSPRAGGSYAEERGLYPKCAARPARVLRVSGLPRRGAWRAARVADRAARGELSLGNAAVVAARSCTAELLVLDEPFSGSTRCVDLAVLRGGRGVPCCSPPTSSTRRAPVRVGGDHQRRPPGGVGQVEELRGRPATGACAGRLARHEVPGGGEARVLARPGRARRRGRGAAFLSGAFVRMPGGRGAVRGRLNASEQVGRRR